jgi:predicted transcriptional regulator
MQDYHTLFTDLGMAKNEARIYEALLIEGERGVGDIAVTSGVHRRNVYDSLQRLIEKGLVFERITATEHRYQAVEPQKLLEIVKEKEARIHEALPALEKLYRAVPHVDDVVVYRGIEGWKNYVRDIIRLGEDVYTIGAKGTWQDERLAGVRAQLVRAIQEKDIHMYWLFDSAVRGAEGAYKTQGFDPQVRFLPEGYDTSSAIDIFGDHVVITTDPTPGTAPDEYSIVTLINQQTADAFRAWFDLLWIASAPAKKGKTRIKDKK